MGCMVTSLRMVAPDVSKFPCTFNTTPEYCGFDRTEWQSQTVSFHRLMANYAKTATTHSGRERIEQEAGMCYSELLRLRYLDIVRCHVMDPMHYLFMGTSKRMLQFWKGKNYLNDSVFDKLQEVMNFIIE